MNKSLFFAFVVLFGAAVVIWSLLGINKSNDNTPELIDFNHHIRPILSDRCFKCHGPDEQAREESLRLDTPEGALSELKDQPGHYAIVPGDIEKSEIISRIFSTDPEIMMPPPESLLALTEAEKETIRKWIVQGAEFKNHWAFLKPEKPQTLPEARKHWAKNPIDHFTFQKMQENNLSPSPEADKVELLKRVSLDLTGLPPSPELRAWYLENKGDDAYHQLVDTLLASKHYGEQMALRWLDVARYADSHGYQDDGMRTMWPWRDWVIHAFNENYDYKKFITWQLAGDILADSLSEGNQKSKEMQLATGFNRNHKITQEGGVIDEEYRVEYVTDRTNTFGKGILALTFECAKCHDHKYDPISQKDYFSTFAFFNQVPEKGIFGTIDASFADPPSMKISNEDVKSILSFINKADTSSLSVMVMKDADELRKTFVLERGNYDSYGEEVGFGLPAAILPFATDAYAPDRLGLTEWLFDEDHPLTSRVYVNRLWEQFFGSGIVKTTGDFGMQGALPTHPELLDWLAVDFQENDWDIKRMVKLMVTSATYRQSSTIVGKRYAIDPDNIYFSRSSRIRLSAENVRDLVLYTGGILNTEIGGPSVKPYQPEGLWESATSGRGTLAKYVQANGDDLYRRGIYTFIKRTVPPPSMLIFDASNRDQCEIGRSNTNTPLQALVMLNDPTVIESAKVLAARQISKSLDVEMIIKEGFEIILCRTPRKEELRILMDFYDNELEYFTENPEKIKALEEIGDYKMEEFVGDVKWAALFQTYHMIFNMEETLIRI